MFSAPIVPKLLQQFGVDISKASLVIRLVDGDHLGFVHKRIA